MHGVVYAGKLCIFIILVGSDGESATIKQQDQLSHYNMVMPQCGLCILNDEALDYDWQVLGITIEGTSGVLGQDEYCPKPQ